MQPVVRACDVGYGNTKYVHAHQPGKEIEAALFPSVALLASGMPALDGGMLGHRNTVRIEVNGVGYEIGAELLAAQDGNHGPILDRSYPTTANYMALVRGALYYMGQKSIDLLVLGLPVSTYSEHREYLKKVMVGEHVIPNSRAKSLAGEPETTTVVVKRVHVFPQPFGGFFDYAIKNSLYAKMKSQTNLLIDPGYYTLDWLVTNGTKPIESRSGAHAGGMSAILEGIAGRLGREQSATLNLTDIRRLDEAVRGGTKLRLFGSDIDISDYMPAAKQQALQFVHFLSNKVGQGTDIDNVIVGGGGAEFFLDAIRAKFPRHKDKIIVSKDPVFANVRGFQLAGEELLARSPVPA